MLKIQELWQRVRRRVLAARMIVRTKRQIGRSPSLATESTIISEERRKPTCRELINKHLVLLPSQKCRASLSPANSLDGMGHADQLRVLRVALSRAPSVRFAVANMSREAFQGEILEKVWPLELFIDVALLLNIGVSFFSAYYSDVNLVADFPFIAIPYLRFLFVVDCVSTLPGLVLLEQGEAAVQLYPLKLLRIFRCGRTLKSWQTILYFVLRRCTSLTLSSISAIMKLCRVLFITIVLIHWLSCAFL